MKWAGICDKGSTWEPVEHLIGDVAKTALHSFKEKRAREATALDEARKAALSGSADPGRVEDDEDKFTGNAENRGHRRRQSSAAWKHYGNKYYDSELKGQYANCKHCTKAIKVVNTSNLMAHISQRHPELLLQEKVIGIKVKALP